MKLLKDIYEMLNKNKFLTKDNINELKQLLSSYQPYEIKRTYEFIKRDLDYLNKLIDDNKSYINQKYDNVKRKLKIMPWKKSIKSKLKEITKEHFFINFNLIPFYSRKNSLTSLLDILK